MGSLTKENIQFIDTYLKNSDIIFTDIRVEMVDHIASEIEHLMENGDTRDFYYIFKDYMIANKKGLVKERKEYYKVADKKIFKMLMKKLLSFQSAIIFLTLLFGFNLINELISDNEMLKLLKHGPSLIILFTAVIYFQFITKRNQRYSSMERIGLYFSLIVQFANLLMNIDTPPVLGLTGLKISVSLFTMFLILLITIAFELKKEYMLKYKSS